MRNRKNKGNTAGLAVVLACALFMTSFPASAAPAVGETIVLYAGTELMSAPDDSGTAVAELAEPMEAEVTGEEENGMIPVRIGVLEGYVASPSQATDEEAETASSYEEGQKECLREDIVNYAVQYVGYPYVYGGSSIETGTDCSGFTQEVFAAFGIDIPRTADAQGDCGTRKSLSEARVGDLILYANGSYAYHVSIYLGDCMTVQAANSAKGIVIEPLYSTASWAVDLIGD